MMTNHKFIEILRTIDLTEYLKQYDMLSDVLKQLDIDYNAGKLEITEENVFFESFCNKEVADYIANVYNRCCEEVHDFFLPSANLDDDFKDNKRSE